MFLRWACLFIPCGLMLAANAPAALTYSTFLRDSFTPKAIATDSAGNVYLAGNAVLDPLNSQITVCVIKLNSQAKAYSYIRFVGGSVNDTAAAIAVDAAGNAYIAGATTSPDFPVTSGGSLATPPTTGTERSFAAKLDAAGNLVFSTLLGGSTNSFAQAVGVNTSGEMLVSGMSVGPGFPSTAGVYSVGDTSFVPYLLELDPTGSHVVFSATGIGGSSMALDSAGNIYVAGTTSSLTYPATPGSYQPDFPVFQICYAPCQASFQGPNQYVTKLDPTGAKILFSTAVSGTGSTMNEGIAVDGAGNVYLTGLAGAGYPYTVSVPTPPAGPALAALATPALPYLSKLDAAGQKLLYSIPVGGAGVQVDAGGNAFAGGVLGLRTSYDVAAVLPALSALPAGCTVPEMTTGESAYAVAVDAGGNVLGTQFIGGSSLDLSGVALAGTTLWLTGGTRKPDFPFTTDALAPSNLPAGLLPGAYLGAVTFGTGQAAGPQIACVVDAADLQPAGPIVPSQLLTIFGSGLGPEQGIAAADYSVTQLGGVSVTFGSAPAPVLYVSASQINVAVPAASFGGTTTVTVEVNGVSAGSFAFPVADSNPALFVLPGSYQTSGQEFLALAYNADGTQNTPANPAQAGSLISVFVNGLTAYPLSPPAPSQLYAGDDWAVTSVAAINPFVDRIMLQVPASNGSFNCPADQSAPCLAFFSLLNLSSLVVNSGGLGPSGVTFGAGVYVSQ